jgi:uncharacterized protein (TIGR03382 family)
VKSVACRGVVASGDSAAPILFGLLALSLGLVRRRSA